MSSQIGGGFRPGQTPGQVSGQAPGLNEKEQGKVQQQQNQRVSSQDAARLAQQAGFQRLGQKKLGKGLDIGDSSRSPIPIPEEDEDAEAYSPEVLEDAQESFAMASAQFSEIAKNEGAETMAETVASASFMPTEQGCEKLQLLADKPAPKPIALEEASTNVKNFFNIELGEDVPPGHRMLATGLVVAGEAGFIEVDKGKLNEKKLAGGVQKVAERSNQAVGEAQKMSKGVSRELNLQRTFVFKR